jgi:hypothetical protein
MDDQPLEAVLSDHARLRATQRGYRENEIAYIIRHGQKHYRTGICFYFLGAKNVPYDDKRLNWVQRLIGTAVLVSTEGTTVITLYKNQKALKQIKRKDKEHRSKRCLQSDYVFPV